MTDRSVFKCTLWSSRYILEIYFQSIIIYTLETDTDNFFLNGEQIRYKSCTSCWATKTLYIYFQNIVASGATQNYKLMHVMNCQKQLQFAPSNFNLHINIAILWLKLVKLEIHDKLHQLIIIFSQSVFPPVDWQLKNAEKNVWKTDRWFFTPALFSARTQLSHPNFPVCKSKTVCYTG
jgi:hypothetical protein